MLQPQDLLTLLLKVAVAASLASILSRFGAFQRMLVSEERTIGQRTRLALSIAAPFAFGVGTRVFIPTYLAVDLGLEGSMVAGLIGGYYTGLLSGVLISLPAMLSGELMTMPLYAGIGVLGGLLRDVAPDKEDIWRFSPFLELQVYRLFRRRYDLRRSIFHLACLLSIVTADLLRYAVSDVFQKPRPVFCLAWLWHSNSRPLEVAAIYISSIFAVTLPLKIWNNFRNEKKLESQQLSLNQARLAALTRQINPHFLFNTLNTVASLIRTNPEEARRMVYKLSAILRTLLRKTENFSPLSEKLRFVKEVDPATLNLQVPSMLLQPLIENSIRHGLSSKVDGGTIRLRSTLEAGRLHLLIEDDGVGIAETRLAHLFDQGIGISNVNERLKVLFGTSYRMWIDSRPGEGTRTGIEIPELSHPLAAVS